MLDKETYNQLKQNDHFILGYMMVTENQDNEIDYIELFDTTIRKNNFGKIMIDRYEEDMNKLLIPKEIIDTSAGYWAAKVLDLYDSEGVITREYIDGFISENGINKKDINWNHLYNLCKE